MVEDAISSGRRRDGAVPLVEPLDRRAACSPRLAHDTGLESFFIVDAEASKRGQIMSTSTEAPRKIQKITN